MTERHSAAATGMGDGVRHVLLDRRAAQEGKTDHISRLRAASGRSWHHLVPVMARIGWTEQAGIRRGLRS